MLWRHQRGAIPSCNLAGASIEVRAVSSLSDTPDYSDAALLVCLIGRVPSHNLEFGDSGSLCSACADAAANESRRSISDPLHPPTLVIAPAVDFFEAADHHSTVRAERQQLGLK